MRLRSLLAPVGMLLAAPPAPAQSSEAPYGYQCEGVASGTRGESVAARIAVDPQGRPIGTATATWSPPQVAGPRSTDLGQPDLTFSIAFVDAGAATIGTPLTSTMTVSVFAPPRDRVAPGTLAARLNGLVGRFRFGDEAFAPVAYLDIGPDDSLPGAASRAARLDLPKPIPGWLDLEFRDGKGNLATSTRFELDGAAARDALFAQAWSKASAALSDYKRCQPTID